VERWPGKVPPIPPPPAGDADDGGCCCCNCPSVAGDDCADGAAMTVSGFLFLQRSYYSHRLL